MRNTLDQMTTPELFGMLNDAYNDIKMTTLCRKIYCKRLNDALEMRGIDAPLRFVVMNGRTSYKGR